MEFEITSSNQQATPLPEWSKDQRMADEKELLGYYFCGHPLDSMRGIIDADKYTKIGLLDDMEKSELKERHSMAGMVRSVVPKVSKAGKKFAIMTIEDFTGVVEMLVWSETYEKMQAMDPPVESGCFIKARVNIQEDDRTGSKRVAAQAIESLVSRKKKISHESIPLTIIMSPTRHDKTDIAHVKDILKRYPGKSVVHIAIKDTLGNSALLELDESLKVFQCPNLEAELSIYD